MTPSPHLVACIQGLAFPFGGMHGSRSTADSECSKSKLGIDDADDEPQVIAFILVVVIRENFQLKKEKKKEISRIWSTYFCGQESSKIT